MGPTEVCSVTSERPCRSDCTPGGLNACSMRCRAQPEAGDRRAASVISSRSEPKSVVGARSARRFRHRSKGNLQRARALHGNAPRRRRQRERARQPGCHPDPNPGSLRYARARTLRRVHAASRSPGRHKAKTHRAFKFSSGTARQPRTNCDASAPDLTATGAEARSDCISHVPTTCRTPFDAQFATAARERARTATSTTMGTTRLGRDSLRDGAAERRRRRHRRRRRRQTPLELNSSRGEFAEARWGERAVFRDGKATRSGKMCAPGRLAPMFNDGAPAPSDAFVAPPTR